MVAGSLAGKLSIEASSKRKSAARLAATSAIERIHSDFSRRPPACAKPAKRDT
jgi:hypothetical protein